MKNEKNKRAQDDFPLFGYDKVKIEQYFDGCSTVKDKKNYIRELALKLETKFKLDKTNEYTKDFEQWFPNLSPIIDHSEYNYVYNDYKKFIRSLKDYILSLEKVDGQEKKTTKSNEVVPINCDGRNKFVWIGNQRQLVYIFVKIRNKYLSNMTDLTFLNLIADCFEGPNKKQFTYEGIKTAYNDVDKQKLRNKDELDKYIDGIDNIK